MFNISIWMGISDLLFQGARLQEGNQVQGKMAQDLPLLAGFAYPHTDGVQDIRANRTLWYRAARYLQNTRPMHLISTWEYAYFSTRLHQQIHCQTGHTVWRRVSFNHTTWETTETVTNRHVEGLVKFAFDIRKCTFSEKMLQEAAPCWIAGCVERPGMRGQQSRYRIQKLSQNSLLYEQTD